MSRPGACRARRWGGCWASGWCEARRVSQRRRSRGRTFGRRARARDLCWCVEIQTHSVRVGDACVGRGTGDAVTGAVAGACGISGMRTREAGQQKAIAGRTSARFRVDRCVMRVAHGIMARTRQVARQYAGHGGHKRGIMAGSELRGAEARGKPCGRRMEAAVASEERERRFWGQKVSGAGTRA